MDRSVRESIQDGQQYVDEPVFVYPKLSVVERSVAQAFRSPLPKAIIVRHERVRLRWMKPDGKGGLVPR